jgi:hypothetical protein
MKGIDFMTKIERAVRQSFEEWSDKIDTELKNRTPEEETEAQESADRVWERIKKEMGVDEQ